MPNLIAGNNLIGFYLVEGAPPNDSAELTAQHGATLIIAGLSEGFPLQINSFSPSITCQSRHRLPFVVSFSNHDHLPESLKAAGH